MTRASFLIAFALSAAVAAQQAPPLPLPGEPALPLPGAEKKADPKKKDAPPPLALPGLDAPAKPAPTAQKPPAATAQKPPAPAAVPAATTTAQKPGVVPATTTATPAKAGQVPPAAQPSPMAASAIRVGEMRLRPDADQQLWTVRGFVGGERSTQQDYTDSSAGGRVGVEGTRWFSGSWLVRGELDWRSSRQAYVPLHARTNSPVFVDENRFDVLATIGYDVGPSLVESGRFELTPMLGVAYLGIRNEAFPADLIGPNGGARVRYALSSAVIVHATLGYTFNLATGSTNSALKNPKGDFATRAGIALPLAGNYVVELDYTGDVLAFENTYRVAHGAALGFGTSF